MESLKKLKIFFFKNILYFIFGAYLTYMFGYYFFNLQMGYILGGDSSRYIDGADNIINWKLPDGKGTSYLGYISYIAIFKYFKLNLTFVVLSQILLTFISSICIYKITKKISSQPISIFVLSLYLFYFPLQMWNFYILTETIFICLIIFIVYFFIFFKKGNIPILTLLIIFYISIKPHGIILIPSLSLTLLIWLYLNNKLRTLYLTVILLIILFFPILSLLNLYLENENIINSIANLGIIWGYEDKNNYLDYKIPAVVNNDLLSLLLFLKNNILTFVIGFFKKIWFFNFRIRPYYSDFHNFYIIAFNLVYWPAAVIGLLKLQNRNNLGIIFMYCMIIFYNLAIGLSWADWDGRFSLYILPLIFIFAGIGFHKIRHLKDKFF